MELKELKKLKELKELKESSTASTAMRLATVVTFASKSGVDMTHARTLVPRRAQSAALTIVLASLTLASACRHEGSQGVTTSFPAPPRHLSDAEIVGVLQVVCRCEMHQAELAATRAASPEVRSYAARMLSEHGSASRQLDDVATRHDLLPEPSMVADTQQEQADALAERLATLAGNPFDRAYVATQITMHREMLRLIDETLLPSVAERELATLLPVLRATMADHLAHAERIQAELEAADAIPAPRSARLAPSWL